MEVFSGGRDIDTEGERSEDEGTTMLGEGVRTELDASGTETGQTKSRAWMVAASVGQPRGKGNTRKIQEDYVFRKGAPAT